MISARIDPASARGIARNFARYRRLTGKTRREVTIEFAKSCAKEIASKVQPFGVSGKKQKQFEGSIGKQVSRAIRNAEISGGGGSAAQAHAQRRNNKGQVPKNLRMSGRRQRVPFENSEVDEIIRKKKMNAGLVKGAWIAAGESLGGKISGIARWIRRHATRNGSSIIREGSNVTSLVIINELNYAEKTISSSNLKSAIASGYRKQYKRMKIQIARIRGDL